MFENVHRHFNEEALLIIRASLVAQSVKNPPALWETWVQSLGWEDSLEKGKVTTPVFWPGEFHGLYSPWSHKELDTTDFQFTSVISQTSGISKAKPSSFAALTKPKGYPDMEEFG